MTEQELSKTKLNIITAAWIGFLSASIATSLFFATFDPLTLVEIATFPVPMTRTTVYSLGFLCFWALLLVNTIVTLWMVKRR